jgi:hypothetical protein
VALFSKMHPGFVAVGVAAAVLAALLFVPAPLGGGDVYWHIAAGRWALENYAVLRIDPFSYTYAGHPWATQDWLAEVPMALAYVGAGWSGVLLLFAAAAALAAGLVTWHTARRLRGPGLPIVLILSFACAAFSFTARPDVLALPLFAIWTAGFVAAGEEGRAPSFKLLPVMILWANLEPGFLAGLIVLAVFGLEAALQSRDVRRWSVFAGFAVIASLITPYGIEGMLHAARLVAAPLYWSVADIGLILTLAFAAIAALLVLGIRRQPVAPLRILLLVWLVFMALVQMRNQMLIAVAAPLVLAGPLAAALCAPAKPAPRQPRVLLVLFAAIAVLATIRLIHPFDRGDGDATPATALAQVPETLARSPVFNERSFGGYLIFNDVRPYIDGRSGLYGRAFQDRYDKMVRPDRALLEDTLSRHHVRWTILAANDPAVGAMDAMTNWHRLYADRWAVVHVRNGIK